MINKILADGVKVGDIFPNDPTEAKKVYKDLIYDRFMRFSEKDWANILVQWKVRVSSGMTRKNVTVLTRKVENE